MLIRYPWGTVSFTALIDYICFKHYSGAPAVQRAARAGPHTHRKWEFMHVHEEPDGKPCLSFFMVSVEWSVPWLAGTVTDDNGGDSVTPSTQVLSW